jgi:hypothetical protein
MKDALAHERLGCCEVVRRIGAGAARSVLKRDHHHEGEAEDSKNERADELAEVQHPTTCTNANGVRPPSGAPFIRSGQRLGSHRNFRFDEVLGRSNTALCELNLSVLAFIDRLRDYRRAGAGAIRRW